MREPLFRSILAMKNRSRSIDKKIEKYCAAAGKEWSGVTRVNTWSILYQFHLWAKERNVRVPVATPADLETFTRDLTPRSRKTYRRKIRRYLRWSRGEPLYYQAQSKRWPQWQWREPNPPSLQKFLNAHSICRSEKTIENYKYALRRFHAWLESTNSPIQEVDERHLLDFSRELSRYDCKSYDSEKVIQRLRIYLYWLHQDGVIRLMDPESCRGERKSGSTNRIALSGDSRNFLAMLSTYLKPRTVANYKAMQLHLHFFLHSKQVKLRDLNRRDLERWLTYLKDASLGPSYRRSTIIRARIYLRWLHEHKKIKTDPDQLLKRGDLPKRPNYLPKPLRPEDDLGLQNALKTRDDTHSKALLLMRWTGLRIGELVDLSHDCVWIDHSDRKFLKVPLGKLNNERMVPITEDTFDLIRLLQQRSTDLFVSGKKPEKLIYSHSGSPISKGECRLTLHSICREIGVKNRVNSHRLRHSYATSLLNGGMSLVCVMKLLGHHSTQMTLLYAAVSPDRVREEYLSAIEKIEDRCHVQAAIEAISSEHVPTIENTFSDLIRLIQNGGQNKGIDAKELKAFVKRLRRVKTEAAELI